MQILVVDDDATNRMVLRRMLEVLGAAVDEAADGEQALAALAGATYSLVLMDTTMPVLDGPAATRELRRREQVAGSPHTPVVALTGAVGAEDRASCAAAGMDGFVAKPVSLDDLRAVLGSAGPATPSPAAMSDTGRAVDTGVLARLVEDLGSRQDVVETVELFLASLPQRSAALLGPRTDGASGRVIDAAHAVKSPSALLGAVGLATACERIEQATREHDHAAVDDTLAGLADLVSRTEIELREWLRDR